MTIGGTAECGMNCHGIFIEFTLKGGVIETMVGGASVIGVSTGCGKVRDGAGEAEVMVACFGDL